MCNDLKVSFLYSNGYILQCQKYLADKSNFKCTKLVESGVLKVEDMRGGKGRLQIKLRLISNQLNTFLLEL